jgi:hypothetical protein
MTETIFPGVYIAERPEGLISAGGVATGIVGVVGTAANGPIGIPITLSDLTDAQDKFGIRPGLPDGLELPDDSHDPLTLVRALRFIYDNGAASVVAVRVADSSQASVTFALQDTAGRTVADLTARTPGTWANHIKVQTDQAKDPAQIEGETHTKDFDKLGYGSIGLDPDRRTNQSFGCERRRRESTKCREQHQVTRRNLSGKPSALSAPRRTGALPR